MHDGRFSRLEEVLEHYAGNVQAGATLDTILFNNNNRGIVLTTEEKKNILTFLRTLDDQEFIQNVMLMKR